MSATNTGRHLENVTLPVDVTELEGAVWWRRFVAVELLRYGPPLCLFVATVGVSLSLVVWIRLQRHLPSTLLYLLVAMILELLPVCLHCGSYTMKRVILYLLYIISDTH